MRMVSESNAKNDRNDARLLATVALTDTNLLHPVSLRSEAYQHALRVLKARDGLVRARSILV